MNFSRASVAPSTSAHKNKVMIEFISAENLSVRGTSMCKWKNNIKHLFTHFLRKQNGNINCHLPLSYCLQDSLYNNVFYPKKSICKERETCNLPIIY